MSGVFSYSDLAHLMGGPFGSTLQHRIRSLIENGYLLKVQRGWFVTPEATLEDVAVRLKPGGYVSLTSALARRGLIGTKPFGILELMNKQGRPGELTTPIGVIRHHVHKPEFHFGFEDVNGLPLATSEKAFIDCCAVHLRGVRLPFQLSTDINWQLLDRAKVQEMLSRYRNPKFIKFVSNMMEEAYGN